MFATQQVESASHHSFPQGTGQEGVQAVQCGLDNTASSAATASASHQKLPPQTVNPALQLLLTKLIHLGSQIYKLSAEPLRVGAPVFLMQLARISGIILMYVMAARLLSTNELAAISLILSLNNVFLLSFAVGIATVLDTQCVRLFGREPSSPRLGLLWRRAVILFLLWCIPNCLLLFTFGNQLSVFIAQSVLPSTAGSGGGGEERQATALQLLIPQVQTFLLWSPVATLALGLFMITQKYFITQNNLWYPFIGHSVSAVCTVAFCHLFTSSSVLLALPGGGAHGHGPILGVALGTGLARLAGVAVLWYLGFVHDQTLKTSFGKWPLKTVLEWKGMLSFLKLLPASLVVSCSERWAFEFLNILAALHGAADLVAYSVMMSISEIAFAISYGTYAAGNFMVGTSLGRNSPSEAETKQHYAIVLCVVATLILDVFIFIFDEDFVKAYLGGNQHDAELLKVSVKTLHFAPFLHLVYNVSNTYQGILRACGSLSYLSKVVPVSHWLISIPIAAVLSLLTPLSVLGVLIGLSIGLSVQVASHAWKLLTRAENFFSSVVVPSSSNNGPSALPEEVIT